MKFKRAKQDRWIRGVCGGVAHTYGWSSNVVRIVTVVIAVIFPGPSTLLAFVIYLLLGFILPSQSIKQSEAQEVASDPNTAPHSRFVPAE